MSIKSSCVSIDDLIRMEMNGEIGYDTDLMPEEIRSPGVFHQPFVFALDISRSMTHKAGNGMSKLDTCLELVNQICYSKAMQSLGPIERNSIDMLALSFEGESVYVNAGWMPLGFFEGIQKPKCGGSTPLYKTFIDSIQATRVIRHHYLERGIACRRPQIFIYTDGRATDMENRELAKQLCRKYAGQEGTAKIFVFMVPGEMSEELFNKTVKDILDLSDNITIVKLTDCVNGLPAAFDFLASSVVVGASSSVGTEMKVKYDPDHLKVANNTAIQGGYMNIGIQ